jgi:outer membrane protein TolC
MKNRKLIFLYIFFIFSTNVFSQTFNDVLKAIEENNTDLQAGEKLVESKRFEYKQDNLPEGPELSYGYFPNNSTVPGPKEVFEVTQSLQMPCYYRNQSAYSKLMISQEELNHLVLRQNILSEAKTLLVEYVFLMKKISVADKRLKFAEDTYNAYLIRLELGDANVLEINKAKLHLLQVQKQEKELRTNVLTIKEKLRNLNGGLDLSLNVDEYPKESLIEIDSLLFEKLASDPEILFNQKAVEASQKQIQVTKNLQLPKFRVGYGSETVVDEKFKGVLVGLTIPLWGSKNAIQKAKIESAYFDLNTISIKQSKIADTKIKVGNIQSLQESLTSYETVLSSVNNEELLSKSLDLGEISLIDFFTEMFYYYEIYDDYLLLEKEYHQALAELYKYKL